MSAQPSHEIDLDVRRLVLDVTSKKLRGLDRRIDESLVDGTLERTIEGASTLTLVVHDPKRVLLRSGMFAYAIEVRLDRLFWTLCKVTKSEDDLTLTFEDREVAELRKHFSPKKASRSSMTRAEFALSLVREVKTGGGIPFICPELHTVVPIETEKQTTSDAARVQQRQRGIAAGADLTAKGKQLTAAQRRLAERMLDVADSLDAGPTPTLALIEACIVESVLSNPSGHTDHDSRGVLQVRDSTASGMGISNTDTAQCANAFLTRGFYHDPQLGGGGAIAISARHPQVSAGRVAQATQGSAKPDEYEKYALEANRIVSAYQGGDVQSRDVVRKLPFQFRRGTADGVRENSWTALQRLASEVHWRCFMSAGACYFASETALLKAKPRLILSESSPGVLGIDFDVDGGKVISEVTITARANRWTAAPGAVVELHDCGPADGRWLVSTISRPVFEATAEIRLKRPTKPLAEPAPETETTSSLTTTVARSIGTAGSKADLAYRAAKAIDAKRYPYVWGGGHGKAGSPSGGGYDCSGSTVAVLAAAGMGFRPGGPSATSGGLESWGEAGPGQYVTVWCNAKHVFMVFHVDGKDEHFGTGDWGKGFGGAGFNPRMHPTSGFTARHWPGT